MGVGAQGAVQFGGVQVGPEGRGVVVLAVGGLPEEEVADALFAAGADDQVGIRAAFGVEVAPEEGFVHLFRGDGVVEDAAHGLEDFVASAVVEGDVEGYAGVVAGDLFGAGDGVLQAGVQGVRVAEVDEADAGFVEGPGLGFNFLGEDGHQAVDFVGGAAPVFGGEGVEGDYGDAAFSEGGDDAADVGDATAVAVGAGPGAPGGPASVAVHNDGDVGRGRHGVRRAGGGNGSAGGGVRRVWRGQKAGGGQRGARAERVGRGSGKCVPALGSRPAGRGWRAAPIMPGNTGQRRVRLP